jgi:hypothetical protein|eukprot:COSAG06_NODE_119_length_23111_cov_51.658613_17_plen_49_part_00
MYLRYAALVACTEAFPARANLRPLLTTAVVNPQEVEALYNIDIITRFL